MDFYDDDIELYRRKGSVSSGSGGYLPQSYSSFGQSRNAGHGASGSYGGGGQYSRRNNKPSHKEDEKRSKKKRRVILLGAGSILLLAVLIFGAFKLFEFFETNVDLEPGTEVSVSIPSGASTKKAADILKKAGLIDNATQFASYVAEAGQSQNIKPGDYTFVVGMEFNEIMDILVAGPNNEAYTLLIPEGFTVRQIAKRVEEVCDIPADAFMDIAMNKAADYVSDYPFLSKANNGSMEGFLFPKTYSIPVGSSADDVIRVLLSQFALEVSQLDMNALESRGVDAYQVLTVASMIEKETSSDDERAKVASVIYNRWEAGWYLGIDATIIYALDGDASALSDNLDIDSPFNTRNHKGLTPTPICNPGLLSIQAALYPEDTDYYYYVAESKSSDTHVFCKTEAEFLKAKAAYQNS